MNEAAKSKPQNSVVTTDWSPDFQALPRWHRYCRSKNSCLRCRSGHVTLLANRYWRLKFQRCQRYAVRVTDGCRLDYLRSFPEFRSVCRIIATTSASSPPRNVDTMTIKARRGRTFLVGTMPGSMILKAYSSLALAIMIVLSSTEVVVILFIVTNHADLREILSF